MHKNCFHGFNLLDCNACMIGQGLTKREYFAALAMQGLLANSTTLLPAENLTKKCVKVADALIEELEK